MTKKTNRFYTTINEAKQLMKLSIYDKWIKSKADMYYDPEGNLIIGEWSGYSDEILAWSTDALIKVCNDLGLITKIDKDGLYVSTAYYSDYTKVDFEVSIDGTCLPWVLVKVIKEYDKKYGAK